MALSLVNVPMCPSTTVKLPPVKLIRLVGQKFNVPPVELPIAVVEKVIFNPLIEVTVVPATKYDDAFTI